MIGMALVVQVLPQVRILKVHISDSKSVRVRLGVGLAIRYASSCEFLELHNILGECARLVREDVVDHAELLVEVARVDLGLHVLLNVV